MRTSGVAGQPGAPATRPAACRLPGCDGVVDDGSGFGPCAPVRGDELHLDPRAGPVRKDVRRCRYERQRHVAEGALGHLNATLPGAGTDAGDGGDDALVNKAHAGRASRHEDGVAASGPDDGDRGDVVTEGQGAIGVAQQDGGRDDAILGQLPVPRCGRRFWLGHRVFDETGADQGAQEVGDQCRHHLGGCSSHHLGCASSRPTQRTQVEAGSERLRVVTNSEQEVRAVEALPAPLLARDGQDLCALAGVRTVDAVVGAHHRPRASTDRRLERAQVGVLKDGCRHVDVHRVAAVRLQAVAGATVLAVVGDIVLQLGDDMLRLQPADVGCAEETGEMRVLAEGLRDPSGPRVAGKVEGRPEHNGVAGRTRLRADRCPVGLGERGVERCSKGDAGGEGGRAVDVTQAGAGVDVVRCRDSAAGEGVEIPESDGHPFGVVEVADECVDPLLQRSLAVEPGRDHVRPPGTRSARQGCPPPRQRRRARSG